MIANANTPTGRPPISAIWDLRITAAGTPFRAATPHALLDDMRRSPINDTAAAIFIFHAREFLDRDLNLRERIDARFARLTKELIEMKAVKQMLRRTSED